MSILSSTKEVACKLLFDDQTEQKHHLSKKIYLTTAETNL